MYIYVIATILTALSLWVAQIFNKKSIALLSVTNNELDYKVRESKCYSYLFIAISVLPLFLVSGLRYGVGTDYFFTYYPRFYQILYGASPYTEKPFVWLNQLIILFTDNVQWLFIITALIFNLFLILSIKKMSNNWLISGLLVVLGNFFFISMNNVRQACAMSIATYAFSFASEKKYVKCGILTLLASCFHITSLVLIPIYLFSGIRKINKFIIPTLVILTLLSPTYLPLCRLIFNNTKYAIYFNLEGNDSPLYTYMICHGIVFVLSLLAFKKNKENKYYTGLVILNSIALIISLLSFEMRVNETITRTVFYFTWAIIFLVPSFLELTKYKALNLCIVILILIICGCSTYYTSVYLGHHEVFPYRSIFNS